MESEWVPKEYADDNFYARFDTATIAAEKCMIPQRLVSMSLDHEKVKVTG